jgi:poly(3-hydroxybutyrate) depolymerase
VPKDAIIVSHSFGVICALEFMLRWPGRVSGAVLSDWVASQAQAAKRSAWCDSHGSVCRLFKQQLKEPWFERGLTNKMLGTRAWGPYGNGTGGFLQDWDVRQHLTSLRDVPTLSFGAEYDIVFASDVEAMSRELQGDYVYLPNAGHLSFVDRKDQWLASFEAWLPKATEKKSGSVGCRIHASASGSELPMVHTVGQRRYFLRLPRIYEATVPHSLVLSFHGLVSQPQDALYFNGNPEPSAKVIFAFPEGMADSSEGTARRTWNGSGSVGSPGPAGATCKRLSPPPCCDSCVEMGGCIDNCWLTTCADDVGFVQSILADIETKFCVDAKSVHAVGFSGGGWLALELGTNARIAHRFQSISAIAGLPFRGFNRPPAMSSNARFLGIYGSQDTLVPGFPNGQPDPTEALAAPGWFFSTWRNTSRLWASTLGCGGLKTSSQLSIPEGSPLSCFDYACTQAAISVCLWDGPHAIPPGTEQVVWQTLFPDGSKPLSDFMHSHGIWLLYILLVGAILLAFLAVLKQLFQRKVESNFSTSLLE